MATKKQAGETLLAEKENIEADVEVAEEVAVAETEAEEIAVAPAEACEEEPKVAEQSETSVEERGAEQTETEEVPVFIIDPKDRQPKNYATYIQLAARYTEEQAQNMLRKKIYQYNEVHLRFLQKVGEDSAFAVERLYVPVACGRTDVRYSWKTKTNQTKNSHEAICVKEKRFSGMRKDLDVENFDIEDQPEVSEIGKSELVEDGAYDFKKAMQAFNLYLKTTAPAKHVTVEKRGETYTLAYVPVLKTACTLDGETYVGYVNMYNGACYSDYKVSDVLENAAEKTVVSAKLAKRTLAGTFLFALTFALLTLFSGLSLVDWKFGALPVKTLWTSLSLAAFSLPSVALLFPLHAIKKEKLIEKSIQGHKNPSGAFARLVSFIGVLCAIGAVVLFFFQVMI
ncbi:MAG: hypothetical protein E7352_05410 [Clostridiales bacterium]|nr:hypothetical protein [Clostridiales bacterium]